MSELGCVERGEMLQTEVIRQHNAQPAKVKRMERPIAIGTTTGPTVKGNN
jgi:hypothetical protein